MDVLSKNPIIMACLHLIHSISTIIKKKPTYPNDSHFTSVICLHWKKWWNITQLTNKPHSKHQLTPLPLGQVPVSIIVSILFCAHQLIFQSVV